MNLEVERFTLHASVARRLLQFASSKAPVQLSAIPNPAKAVKIAPLMISFRMSFSFPFPFPWRIPGAL